MPQRTTLALGLASTLAALGGAACRPGNDAAPDLPERRASPPVPLDAAAGPVPGTATQLVLVTAPDWDSPRGRLRRHSRRADGSWEAIGGELPVTLGASGLAWGRGHHGEAAPPGRTGPLKREGDGRTPAGVFDLGSLHGTAETGPAGARLAYHRLTAGWECVDDPRSRRYNQLLDASGSIDRDWTSSERMAEVDVYRLLVTVAHNPAPARPGAGSCIFLHPWASPDAPTAGCVAMADESLTTLARWLQPGEAVLVVLPAQERSELGATWGLPWQESF